MENFKKILLGIIIGYVMIFSSMFIYSMYRINIQMNYKYEYSNIETYDETMLSNKERLNTYTNLVNTQEEKKCLNTISEMIDESYKTYYTESVTTSELINNYYDSDTKYAVFTNCNITENTSSLISPLIISNNLLMQQMISNVSTSYEITLPDYLIHLIAVPATDSISYRTIKVNESNIIKFILNEVGEQYEQ